jgi:hypothetical protein
LYLIVNSRPTAPAYLLHYRLSFRVFQSVDNLISRTRDTCSKEKDSSLLCSANKSRICGHALLIILVDNLYKYTSTNPRFVSSQRLSSWTPVACWCISDAALYLSIYVSIYVSMYLCIYAYSSYARRFVGVRTLVSTLFSEYLEY